MLSKCECMFLFHADTNPAPNQYQVSHNQRSTLRNTPAYTMGRKLSGDRPASSTHPSPSPAEYCPKMADKPKACTITPRRKTRTGTFVHVH